MSNRNTHPNTTACEQAKRFLTKIDRMNRRIEAMMETADGYIKKSRHEGAMSDVVIKTFVNLAAELQQESVKLRKTVDKARKIIDLLDSEDEKLLVELRYFHGLKIESIANIMRCCRATVYNIQQSAINHVQEMIDNKLVSIDE